MLLNLGITVVVLQCVMNVLSFTNPKGPNIRRMIPRPTPTPMKSLRKPLVSWRNETIYVGNPPHVLISGLDLSFGGGQRLAIIGENGCGKSILTQRMARSFSPERYAASTPQRRVLTRGELAMGFHELEALDEVRRRKRYTSPEGSAKLSSSVNIEHDAAVYFISFESHRRLLHEETTEFHESRFTVVHKRATPASFLFPELYPDGITWESGRADSFGYVGYRPSRTRLAPLPVPFDANYCHPILVEYEEAMKSYGKCVGLWLRQLGMWEIRHRPIFQLSTGECKKLLLVDFLWRASQSKSKSAQKPSVLVLDEAFDGLDANSREDIAAMLRSAFLQSNGSVLINPQLSLVHITHNFDDLLSIPPTHVLMLERKKTFGSSYTFDTWKLMKGAVQNFFDARRNTEVLVDDLSAPLSSVEGVIADPLVEFRNVTVSYPGLVTTIFEQFSWTVREGENWAVCGPNGCGKSTLIELITGDNPLAYQSDISLFGRKRGTGESIWDIKKNIGMLSTAFHMEFTDYSDNSVRAYGHTRRGISTWEVVCSGFTDSIGLYSTIGPREQRIAKQWIRRFNLEDLCNFPKENMGQSSTNILLRQQQQMRQPHLQNFFTLSHGQQKLVLLCRAVVKNPLLLLLDEPTHGLSYDNRDRLLFMLKQLSERKDIAIVYVTHRQEELDFLNFRNVLRL